LAAVGEISLAGEIRPVAAAKQRAAEARRLGYTTIVDSEVGSLREVIRVAFASAAPGDRVDVAAF
jgi:DNA repair protein RadA/Sms